MLAEHLEALSFDSRSPIAPGERVSGFVYANWADPSMMLQVDLIGREWSDSIGLVVPVPGTEAAQQRMAALSGLHIESELWRSTTSRRCARPWKGCPVARPTRPEP